MGKTGREVIYSIVRPANKKSRHAASGVAMHQYSKFAPYQIHLINEKAEKFGLGMGERTLLLLLLESNLFIPDMIQALEETLGIKQYPIVAAFQIESRAAFLIHASWAQGKLQELKQAINQLCPRAESHKLRLIILLSREFFASNAQSMQCPLSWYSHHWTKEECKRWLIAEVHRRINGRVGDSASWPKKASLEYQVLQRQGQRMLHQCLKTGKPVDAFPIRELNRRYPHLLTRSD